MQGIDRLMAEDAEYSDMLRSREILLPMVEQLDPALVPEYFWRIVATRPSVGDPRSVNESSSAWLTSFLAWYDRDVAAAVFEPVRAWLDHADDRELASAMARVSGLVDLRPRAAVARLEQVPVDPQRDLDRDSAALGLPPCSVSPTRHAGEICGIATPTWKTLFVIIYVRYEYLVRSIAAEFDSGPLAHLLYTRAGVEVGK